MTRKLFINPSTPGVVAPLATLTTPTSTAPVRLTQECYVVSNLGSTDGQFYMVGASWLR